MDNKNIAYLNSKVWYRLVKVLFIGLFVFVFSVYNFAVFSGGIRTLDLEKTLVTCNSEESQGKTFNLKDAGLYLTANQMIGYNYTNFYTNQNDADAVDTILTVCSVRGVDFTKVPDWDRQTQRFLDQNNYNMDIVMKEIEASSSPSYLQHLKPLPDINSPEFYHAHLFDISPAYSYTKFVEYFLIGNLIIMSVFFLMRSLFFYIVLGKLQPAR